MFFIIATILLALSFLTNKLQKTISILALAVDAFLVAYPAVRHNADYNLYKLSYSQQLDNFEKGYWQIFSLIGELRMRLFECILHAQLS